MIHLHDQARRVIIHRHRVIIVIIYSNHIAVPVNSPSEELLVKAHLGLPRVFLECFIAA